ncbi:MAG TPA: GyrI-like domain-containing protein [Beijerinckiaceae bacterium]|nr:GyrI-like domain-containing protein [Beijerinckiaceae bacterium]
MSRLSAMIVVALGLACAPLAAVHAQQPPAPVAGEPKPSADASSATEILLQARPVLTLKGQSSWDDGYEALMKAFSALRAEAKRLGLEAVDKPRAVFSETSDTNFRYTAMITLAREPESGVKPASGMTVDRSPEGKAYMFSHVGAYDDIDSIYEAITAWLDEKGLTARGEFIEEYLNEPQGSDDALLELKIYVFVK